MLELKPILPTLEENAAFDGNPDCAETLQMSIDYYRIIGYHPPWICYYVFLDGNLVGSAAFKGQPDNNRIEIAYGTLPRFRNKGIGTAICKQLVQLALKTDPGVTITARTLPEENYSTRILKNNHFFLAGPVMDKDDGTVWEWVLK